VCRCRWASRYSSSNRRLTIWRARWGFWLSCSPRFPRVVYGLWGIFVLAPVLRVYVEPFLAKWFGFLPLFQGSITGIGLLTGGIILAIMVTPIISAVVRDVLDAVPSSQREAALALGATKWETTRVVLVNGVPGIAGAIILGLGRALVKRWLSIWLSAIARKSASRCLSRAYSIASAIANEFTEATQDLYLSALVELGLILFFGDLFGERRRQITGAQRYPANRGRRSTIQPAQSISLVHQTALLRPRFAG